MAITALLVFQFFGIAQTPTKGEELEDFVSTSFEYESHESITLSSQWDFEYKNGVVSGLGTVDDPYIIEGYEISNTETAIELDGTSVYYVIRNVYIHDTESTAIKLSGSVHGKIINCRIENNQGYGIRIENSEDTVFSNNVITGNTDGGINITNAQGNVISDSVIDGNGGAGIELDNSQGNTITNNSISENAKHGVYLSNGAQGNTISKNTVRGNDKTGLYMNAGDSNEITYNSFEENNKGVYIEAGANNMIHHNSFIDNIERQAFEAYTGTESGDQWDDGSEGNHWSNYTGSDSDNDGIGDEPYIINSIAGVIEIKDNYPLMEPINTKPTAIITSPQCIVSGEVTLRGYAFDDQGVEKVEVKIEGKGWVEVDVSGKEWTFSLDTTQVDDGFTEVSVRAHDGSEYSEDVSVEGFVIANKEESENPTVSNIDIDVDGDTTKIEVSAEDNTQIAKVEIWVDGELRGVDKYAPYTWEGKGSEETKAVAFDIYGNQDETSQQVDGDGGGGEDDGEGSILDPMGFAFYVIPIIIIALIGVGLLYRKNKDTSREAVEPRTERTREEKPREKDTRNKEPPEPPQ
ncbi:MAG: right-handed parallel beta-helix repeat-containing protein [Candidatus Thermoplasmatota archaeon]